MLGSTTRSGSTDPDPTPDELRAAADRAEELLAAATPGPWRVGTDDSAARDQLYLYTEHDDGSWVDSYKGPYSLDLDPYDPTATDRANLDLIAAAPDLLAVLAPAARQYADTQDENERLRNLCGFLIDACATHRIPVPLNSSLLDLAADIASDGGAAAAALGDGT